nr:GAF domain-containing protein [uncultured Rhodopila sp.]
MTDSRADAGAYDLTNCDREPIHIPGSVLPHGALPASDPDDLRIVHAGGDTVGTLCEAVVGEVRAVTGFDRVMADRFLPDDSGTVLAEARHPDVEGFPGLHYPPSDIPKRARTLYISNWSRLIPGCTLRIRPHRGAAQSGDRAPVGPQPMHAAQRLPVHRQYLADMGVVASMSLSLIVRGKLWGLIACHHATPRYLAYRTRDTCEIFAAMISTRIETLVVAEGLEGRTTTAHASGTGQAHEPGVRSCPRADPVSAKSAGPDNGRGRRRLDRRTL